jgi:ABC-type Zn uptake system ZnuABC Zn-binding protein ZnuA
MVLRSALLVALLAAASAAFAQERVQVVTTTTDLRSLAEAVGGDRIVAVSLVPPGMDAEEYQPKPQDAFLCASGSILTCGSIAY